MQGYGQFCPVAKATEIIGERWTALVLRELLCGSRHFNELRRGVPLMSPALSSRRLKALERAGIVRREVAGTRTSYAVTAAGEELRPLIELLGTWGQRWARAELRSGDLDAGLLMWDIRRNVDARRLPPRRTVIRFVFCDLPDSEASYWLVGSRGEAELCIKDPGYDVDLDVVSELRTLTAVWMGDRPLRDALDAGAIDLHGSREQRAAFREWFALSPLAAVPRPSAR